MKLSLQYIAGLLDGEGYFGIMKLKNKACTLGYYYCPVIKIALRSRDSKVLDILHKQYGGWIDKERKHPNGQSPSRCWVFKYKKHLSEILKELYPHLFIKKKQARILMDFIEAGAVKTRNQDKMNKERIALDSKREILYKKILTLNHRGVLPAETE